jgi:hypothetical protein
LLFGVIVGVFREIITAFPTIPIEPDDGGGVGGGIVLASEQTAHVLNEFGVLSDSIAIGWVTVDLHRWVEVIHVVPVSHRDNLEVADGCEELVGDVIPVVLAILEVLWAMEGCELLVMAQTDLLFRALVGVSV